MQSLRLESSVCRPCKTLMPTTNWIIKSWGMSSLLHFPWANPEFIASPLRDWGRIFSFEHLNKNISLNRLQTQDSSKRLRAARFHNTFECISMHLVLTQPLCILFPQSLKALISGNTSHYLSANSLIHFVRLWWSAMQPEVSGGLFQRNEDAYGARWISCFWDLSERMLHWIIKQTNLFNAVAIFTATYEAHYAGLIMRKFIYLLHPTTSKEDSELSFIALLYTLPKSRKLHLMPHLQPRAKTDIHTCCLHNSLSICILSTSFKLSCSLWLLCLSSRI